MDYLKRFYASNRVLVAMLIWLPAFALLQWWPGSWWMDVRAVQVSNAKAGADIQMLVDRQILRPFSGTWRVNVRRWDGAWVIFCQAGGGGDYRLGARFPQQLDLRWWTTGQCPVLPPGKYMVTTTWIIDSLGLMPDKTISIDSNAFDVTP